MTNTPSEVRAIRLVRSGSPYEFVAVFCGLSLGRVKELHAQQRSHDRLPCQSAREAIRGKRALPKTAVVQYERVEPYLCGGCNRLVYLEPCVACTVRGNTKGN